MRRFVLLLVTMALLATGCGDDDADTTEAPATTVAPATTQAGSTTEAPATTGAPGTTEAPTTTAAPTTTVAAQPFGLTSTVFDDGGDIPITYSCDGDNISPPLDWGVNPPGTITLALLMDDPDSGGDPWDHWVAFDMPSDVTSLPEDVPPTPELVVGGVQGVNDFFNFDVPGFNHIGWDGPCPGPNPHLYVFTLYALDTELGLTSDATLADVLAAIDGHVIDQSVLTGYYPANG